MKLKQASKSFTKLGFSFATPDEDIKNAHKSIAELEKLNADMYEMLEECKSILEGNTYFVKAEKIEQLL